MVSSLNCVVDTDTNWLENRENGLWHSFCSKGKNPEYTVLRWISKRVIRDGYCKWGAA